MNYLIVVYPGRKCSEPTPMAGETISELLDWAQANARGHHFTLWLQDGVMLSKIAYFDNSESDNDD